MGTPMTYISGNTGTYQSGTFNKGTIALNLNPTSLGSGNNWYNGVDVTATQYLIYSDTYTTGIASQANSKPTAWTTPDLSDTSLLNLINTLPDRVGLSPFTSLPLALQWLQITNEYFLIKTNFENIVTSGLILNLDAGWYNSYSGTTTWFDIKGGYNGTLVNGPTFISSSQGSIVFDGTNDYGRSVNIGLTGNIPLSFAFWGKVLTNPSADGGMVLYGTQGSALQVAGIYYRNSDNYVRFTSWGADGTDYSTGFLKDFNVWHHWGLVYNGTTVLIYRDGIPDPNGPQTRSINFTSSTLEYGGATSNNSYLNQNISNIQLYNKALSAPEVLQNYNAQKSRFGFYDFIQSGLTYSYDAGNYLSYPRSGTTWSNMSNGSNNGTLTNGPVWSSNSGGTITFDGSDDYVAAGNGKTLNNMTVQMSVSVLSNAGGYKGFVGAVGSGNDFDTGFNIDMQGGSTVSFSKCSIEGGFLRVGGGTNFMTSSVPFGQWKNICFTISPTYIQFYLDGVKQFGTNRLNNGSSTIGMNSLVIGARPYSLPNTSINANIRDVIIYDRALSDSEVVQNFEASRKNNVGLTGYTTNGLVLNLDAGNYASYPTTGTKWVDTSGNYNNGTLTNGPVWSNTSGGTITFDGVDDYINIPNGFTNTLKGKQYWTASIWVKVSSWGSNNDAYPVLVSIGANQGQYSELYLEIGSANQYYMAYAGDFASGSFTTNLNQIYNLVYMKDGSSFKLYSNGVLIDTQTGKNSVSSVDGDLWIGRFKTGDYELNGNIYNFTMYDRALSASEILQNYNALKGRFGL
jgi:hypothetical protein